jgi:sugar lactone lactonase YvrE
VTAELRNPVRKVAGCAFGGSDLTDLYVTSAWTGLSAAERRAQPLAGALSRVKTDVPGVPIGAIPPTAWVMSADPKPAVPDGS